MTIEARQAPAPAKRFDFSALGGVYNLHWPVEQVEATVDRIAEDSKHTVTGEVTVRTTVPGHHQHLHQARLNLTSTSSRHGLAKYLNERMSTVDWDTVLEELCISILRKMREGEPLLSMQLYPMPAPDQYRIWPIVPLDKPTLLFGEGGAGKSLVAQLFALLVAGAVESPIGFHPRPGNVLWLDYETSPEDMKERIEWLRSGLGVDYGIDIMYRFCYQPLATDIAEIRRKALETKAEMVVVDSAGLACGGDPQNPESTLAYFAALRSLQCTTLTIAHTQKNADKKSPFGSVYWINIPRSVWEIKTTQEPGDDAFTVGLLHRKANRGKLLAPVGLRFTFGQASIAVHRQDVSGAPEIASGLSLKVRIKQVLRLGAMTAEEIAEELDTGVSAVRARLSEGLGKEWVKVSGEGQRLAKWGILHQDGL